MNTTPQIENEGIIRKIQRLLALGQSPNEAEANLAMAKAQELLAKHNLEAAMVKDAFVPGGTVVQEEKLDLRPTPRLPSNTSMIEYQQKFASAIARQVRHQLEDRLRGPAGGTD